MDKKAVKKQIKENLESLKDSQNKYGGVYIAVMRIDSHYDLEVELDQGNIAFTVTSKENRDEAQDEADILDNMLSDYGINVFWTREEWEDALDDE